MTFIKKYTKTISYIALIVLILSLIPLMILGFFAHPVGDDYYYAKEAVFAYKSTGNFPKGSFLRIYLLTGFLME